MSAEHDDLILTRSADSTLTLAEWLRVGAAAGAAWRIDPADALVLAQAIEDDERMVSAMWSLIRDQQRKLRIVRACLVALAASNIVAWWLL